MAVQLGQMQQSLKYDCYAAKLYNAAKAFPPPNIRQSEMQALSVTQMRAQLAWLLNIMYETRTVVDNVIRRPSIGSSTTPE